MPSFVTSFLESLVKNQISTVAGMIGGSVGAYGTAAGYTPAQVTGAVACILAIALQYAENEIAKKAKPPATPAS